MSRWMSGGWDAPAPTSVPIRPGASQAHGLARNTQSLLEIASKAVPRSPTIARGVPVDMDEEDTALAAYQIQSQARQVLMGQGAEGDADASSYSSIKAAVQGLEHVMADLGRTASVPIRDTSALAPSAAAIGQSPSRAQNFPTAQPMGDWAALPSSRHRSSRSGSPILVQYQSSKEELQRMRDALQLQTRLAEASRSQAEAARAALALERTRSQLLLGLTQPAAVERKAGVPEAIKPIHPYQQPQAPPSWSVRSGSKLPDATRGQVARDPGQVPEAGERAARDPGQVPEAGAQVAGRSAPQTRQAFLETFSARRLGLVSAAGAPADRDTGRAGLGGLLTSDSRPSDEGRRVGKSADGRTLSESRPRVPRASHAEAPSLTLRSGPAGDVFVPRGRSTGRDGAQGGGAGRRGAQAWFDPAAVRPADQGLESSVASLGTSLGAPRGRLLDVGTLRLGDSSSDVDTWHGAEAAGGAGQTLAGFAAGAAARIRQLEQDLGAARREAERERNLRQLDGRLRAQEQAEVDRDGAQGSSAADTTSMGVGALSSPQGSEESGRDCGAESAGRQERSADTTERRLPAGIPGVPGRLARSALRKWFRDAFGADGDQVMAGSPDKPRSPDRQLDAAAGAHEESTGKQGAGGIDKAAQGVPEGVPAGRAGQEQAQKLLLADTLLSILGAKAIEHAKAGRGAIERSFGFSDEAKLQMPGRDLATADQPREAVQPPTPQAHETPRDVSASGDPRMDGARTSCSPGGRQKTLPGALPAITEHPQVDKGPLDEIAGVPPRLDQRGSPLEPPVAEQSRRWPAGGVTGALRGTPFVVAGPNSGRAGSRPGGVIGLAREAVVLRQQIAVARRQHAQTTLDRIQGKVAAVGHSESRTGGYYSRVEPTVQRSEDQVADSGEGADGLPLPGMPSSLPLSPASVLSERDGPDVPTISPRLHAQSVSRPEHPTRRQLAWDPTLDLQLGYCEQAPRERVVASEERPDYRKGAHSRTEGTSGQQVEDSQSLQAGFESARTQARIAVLRASSGSPARVQVPRSPDLPRSDFATSCTPGHRREVSLDVARGESQNAPPPVHYPRQPGEDRAPMRRGQQPYQAGGGGVQQAPVEGPARGPSPTDQGLGRTEAMPGSAAVSLVDSAVAGRWLHPPRQAANQQDSTEPGPVGVGLSRGPGGRREGGHHASAVRGAVGPGHAPLPVGGPKPGQGAVRTFHARRDKKPGDTLGGSPSHGDAGTAWAAGVQVVQPEHRLPVATGASPPARTKTALG